MNRQQRYRLRNPKVPMMGNARQRAKHQGVPFDLKPEDFDIPERCPVLGIKLTHGWNKRATDSSPSLDRLIPSKGYVKDNVAIISRLANTIKSSATPEEIRKVYVWLSKRLKKK